jgi:nucleoside-diphosphate-sugar epimerase
MGRILVVGALGQIGTELVDALMVRYGEDQIIATDIREPKESMNCRFEILDATDRDKIRVVIEKHGVDTVFHLAATLSARAEIDPLGSWNLNMSSLFHMLELSKAGKISKLFWPSSIAVFGSTTPKDRTPQLTVAEPSSVYGISKLAGERWCEYYSKKYGIDVRSLRYPGLIGYKSLPGGGTTDYAVEIFHAALKKTDFVCFLKEDCELPMMYMPDAIRGTMELMEAESESLRIRSAYNFGGISFTPRQLEIEIQKTLKNFSVVYSPDSRQAIAESWPNSIDDSKAKEDWGWERMYSLEAMCHEILEKLPSFI